MSKLAVEAAKSYVESRLEEVEREATEAARELDTEPSDDGAEELPGRDGRSGPRTAAQIAHTQRQIERLNSQSARDKRRKAAGKPRKLSLTEQAHKALARVGGTQFFIDLAKKSPKEFGSLLARLTPQEGGQSGPSVAYKAIPIPVECRDQIPALLAAATTDGQAAIQSPAPATQQTDDDWL